MRNLKNASEAIQGLIKINNDRIEGYKKAADHLEVQDQDLQAMFSNFADQSESFKSELANQLQGLRGDDQEETTASGKVFRAWMDVKSFFSGNDRKAMLESCEYGEDAAQMAYKEALEDDELPIETRSLIQKQKEVLRLAHDQVKSLRDQEKSK